MPKTPKAEPSYSHRRHYQKLEFDPEVPYTLTLPLSRRRPSTRETNEAGRQDTDRPVPTPPGPAVPILQSNQEMDVDFREGEGDTPEGSIASTSVRAEGDAGASEASPTCSSSASDMTRQPGFDPEAIVADGEEHAPSPFAKLLDGRLYGKANFYYYRFVTTADIEYPPSPSPDTMIDINTLFLQQNSRTRRTQSWIWEEAVDKTRKWIPLSAFEERQFSGSAYLYSVTSSGRPSWILPSSMRKKKYEVSSSRRSAGPSGLRPIPRDVT